MKLYCKNIVLNNEKQSNFSFGKLILTSTLGTTLSIALTFGMAQWFEHQKKKDDMCHMMIHDIDNTTKHLRETSE